MVQNERIIDLYFPFPALPGQVPDLENQGYNLSRSVFEQHPLLPTKSKAAWTEGPSRFTFLTLSLRKNRSLEVSFLPGLINYVTLRFDFSLLVLLGQFVLSNSCFIFSDSLLGLLNVLFVAIFIST